MRGGGDGGRGALPPVAPLLCDRKRGESAGERFGAARDACGAEWGIWWAVGMAALGGGVREDGSIFLLGVILRLRETEEVGMLCGSHC